MKSMKLREQAGAGQGLPKSEFAHASRVASGQLGGSLPGSEVDYSGVPRLHALEPSRYNYWRIWRLPVVTWVTGNGPAMDPAPRVYYPSK